MVCDICQESYTGRTVEVQCSRSECEYSICRGCLRQYLLDKPQAPHCPACTHEYDNAFAIAGLGKTWYQTVYRQTRKAVIVERELQLLPKAAARLPHYQNMRAADKEVTRAREQIRALQAQLREAQRVYRTANARKASLEGNVVAEAEPVRFKCPAADCNGFVSSQWKCGTCSLWTCKHCREIIGPNKDDPHECDPAILASVQQISAIGKPCPGCKVFTERSEGCSQMYCTRCGCWWNYRTGKKDTSTFRHNPHHAAMVAAGNAVMHQDDCALGVLDRSQARLIVTKMTFLWRNLLPGYPGTAAIRSEEDLVQAVGRENSDRIQELFRQVVHADVDTETLVRGLTITRPFRRLYRVLAVPRHLQDVTGRLEDNLEGSPAIERKATDIRVAHILGEASVADLRRHAWKRHSDSGLASAQIDVLKAANDVIGNALLGLHDTLNTATDYSSELIFAELLPNVLAQLQTVHNAFVYTNQHTNKVKMEFSRAAWGFDLNGPFLRRSKSLTATPESLAQGPC